MSDKPSSRRPAWQPRRGPANPYRAPARPAPPRSSSTSKARGWARRWVLWVLLLGPYVFGALAVVGIDSLLKWNRAAGLPVANVFACCAGALASTTVRMLATLPTTWLLERIVGAIRPQAWLSHRLQLKAAVLMLYVAGGFEVLKGCGYLSKTHAAFKAFDLTMVILFLSAIPLLFIWGAWRLFIKGRR